MCRSSSARRRRRLGLSCNATPWQTLIWRDIFPFYGSRYFTQIYIFVFYWIYLAKQYCAWKWTRVLWAILPLCSLFLSLCLSLVCAPRCANALCRFFFCILRLAQWYAQRAILLARCFIASPPNTPYSRTFEHRRLWKKNWNRNCRVQLQYVFLFLSSLQVVSLSSWMTKVFVPFHWSPACYYNIDCLIRVSISPSHTVANRRRLIMASFQWIICLSHLSERINKAFYRFIYLPEW